MSWKFCKKDDLALPDLKSDYSFDKAPAGLDLCDHFQGAGGSLPPMQNQTTFSQSYPLPQNNQPFPPGIVQNNTTPFEAEPSGHGVQKDLEIIAAKLDTIRAQLEMLNARVGNLEHQSRSESPKRPWY